MVFCRPSVSLSCGTLLGGTVYLCDFKKGGHMGLRDWSSVRFGHEILMPCRGFLEYLSGMFAEDVCLKESLRRTYAAVIESLAWYLDLLGI